MNWLRKTQFIFVLIASLGIAASANSAIVRRVADKDTSLQTISLFGSVDQSELDTAMTYCDPGCNLYVHPGTTIEGTIAVTSTQASGFKIVGPRRGAKPVWSAPVVSSFAGDGENGCGTGFTCQSEQYAPLISIATGAPDNIIIKHLEFDGRKDEQPAPQPEDCLASEHQETGSCIISADQRLISVQGGSTGHLIKDVEIYDAINMGIFVRNSDDVEIDSVNIYNIGCHPTQSGLDCGSYWNDVTYPVPSLGAGLVRQSNGFGVQINDQSDNAHIHDSTIGDVTKIGIELFGFPGGCAHANRSAYGIIEDNTSTSEIAANQHCSPTIQNNTISGVRIDGEEGSGVAACIQIADGGDPSPANASGGGSRVLNNTCDNIQGQGIVISDRLDDHEVSGNVLSNLCATTTIECAGITTAAAMNSDDLRIYRNQIDVSNGLPEYGILLYGDTTSTKIALNNIHGGGAVGSRAAALKIHPQNTTDGDFDVRYNTLAWDTDMATAAAVFNGGTITLQADAFGDIEAGAGVGATNHSSETVRQTSTGGAPTIINCASDLSQTGCYDEYTVAFVPDTQNMVIGGLGLVDTANTIEEGYLDEVIQWIIDARDSFQLERTVNSAEYPADAHNIKFVAGVGDIVADYSHTTQMQLMRDLYNRLNDSTYTPIPIPHVEPPGNHDVDDNIPSAIVPTNYQGVFTSSRYTAIGRSIVRASTDGVGAYPVTGDSKYTSNVDLAVAQRFKPLNQWTQIITIPWTLNSNYGVAWADWSQERVDEFVNDYSLLVTHESVHDSSPYDGVCELFEDPDELWLNILDDSVHTNAGLGYRSWYASLSGHESSSNGWFCRNDMQNTAGDSVIRTGANFQDTNTLGLSLSTSPNLPRKGDGWTGLLTFDYGDRTVHGQLYSPLIAGGGYAADVNPFNPPLGRGIHDWTEYLDFNTRGLENTLPVVSSFSNDSFDNNSAEFSWTTDKASTSQIECGTTSGEYTVSGALYAPLVTTHSSIVISGLSSNTNYFCRAVSTDRYENVGYSPSEVTFTTTGAVVEELDLGDLNIAATRIPKWYPATAAEATYTAAQAWPEYDATCLNTAGCPSGKTGFGDAPGDVMDSCSVANPANDGSPDWSALNCMVDNAPDSSVIYVPAGTYDMGSAIGQAITIQRNNIVLRCEDPATTHLRAKERVGFNQPVTAASSCAGGFFNSNENCRAMVVSTGNNFDGSAVTWTSGFTEGETVIGVSNSSGFTVGGWARLNIPSSNVDCPNFLPEQGNEGANLRAALQHIAKVVSKDASSITLDRGLRMDYTADPGCTASAEARPYNTISGIGVENCHLTTDPTIVQDTIRDFGFVSLGPGVVESWVVGNVLERAEAKMADFVYSARNWFQGNHMKNYGRIDQLNNTAGVTPRRGSVDNVIENNAFSDFVVGVYLIHGSEGTIVSYNYFRHGSPPNIPERAFMNHGLYTREILIEGNDADGEIITADHYWGPNGPRITAFRNRIVGSNRLQVLSVNKEKDGPWPIADYMNWLGNNAYVYLAGTSPNAVNFPEFMNEFDDMDGHGSLDSAFVHNMHIEKNLFRATQTCNGDPTPNRCGFHMDTPRAETHCGTVAGPNDCNSNGGVGNNAGGTSAPIGWATDNVPHSLYRYASSEPPSWWCQEACDWDDVHNGIGAWGDDEVAGYCKLPAQIIAEGGTCTACGPGGAGC